MSTPHDREAAAAVAGMHEIYGAPPTSPGWWDGYRRRWEEDQPVLFYHRGQLARGHIMRAEYGEQRDTYFVRRHMTGGGTEIVEVQDKAMLIY